MSLSEHRGVKSPLDYPLIDTIIMFHMFPMKNGPKLGSTPFSTPKYQIAYPHRIPMIFPILGDAT